MKKTLCVIATVGMIGLMVACHKNAPLPGGTAYLDLPGNPYHYFAADYTGELNNHKATLGRVLFYDGHLSVNNTVSCASCHKQVQGFADNTAFSKGYEGKVTKRNSKGIANLAGSDSFLQTSFISQPFQALFWDGRENILQNLVSRPITNHVEMGMDDPAVIPVKLASLSMYAPLFQNAYGDNNITSDRISECIAYFMASIRTGNSRFAQFSSGKQDNLTTEEKRGMTLFTQTYNCEGCHHVFSNIYTPDVVNFKDIGLDANPTDNGYGTISRNADDNGKFRVPSLSNVGLTAPYMHDGRFKTLSDVIDHYSHGVQASRNLDPLLQNGNSTPVAMNIPDNDKKALIAFLNTLTDYQMTADPKFSNPFKTK